MPRSTAPKLFFTTQRFTTPAKPDPPYNTESIAATPEHSQHHHSQRDLKGKAKETRLVLENGWARSRSRAHDGTSSDDSLDLDHPRAGSSSITRTPRGSKNPHIYGHQDTQMDGEVSIITAETPMHQKNRQFRRAGGKQRDGRADLGHDSVPAMHMLQRFDSSSSSASHGQIKRDRRGSRGSSIGSGHEALPHPRIPPAMLHRHIRADLPPAVRCRTLLSWAGQKAEHATYTALYPTFTPTRFVPAELPKPLAAALAGLALSNAPGPSKLVAKTVKMALKGFIRGVCESEVEVNWGTREIDEELSLPDLSMVDLDSLPPHPQDLKNERKIKELDNWRTRMSYEDNARQLQLTRYGTLIDGLTGPLGPLRIDRPTPLRPEEDDGLLVDLRRLGDRASLVEYGRMLRDRGESGSSRSIDVSEQYGNKWTGLPVNVGALSETLTRLSSRLKTIEHQVKRLQSSSTLKLKELDRLGEISSIEAKMMIGTCSIDGVEVCLKALVPSPGRIGRRMIEGSSHQDGTDGHLGGGSIGRTESFGRRDFLKSLSRCPEDHASS